MACFDIPEAYLHAETDKDIIMVLEGPLEEIMVNVDPSLYNKYVTTKPKGKPMIYVNMHKAFYLMLHSALLLYKNLLKNLEYYGFGTN